MDLEEGDGDVSAEEDLAAESADMRESECLCWAPLCQDHRQLAPWARHPVLREPGENTRTQSRDS